jgi:hypothetical protein
VCRGTVVEGGGVERGVETTGEEGEGVGDGDGGREVMVSRCFTIAWMFPGSDARVMIVVTPTEAANSAAMSLVTIPPVPMLLPGEDTTCQFPPFSGGRETIRFNYGDIFDNFNCLCIWICPWIIRVQTIHIRHQKQVIRIHHPRRNRTQRIVISKPNLTHRNRIILIHNRNNPHGQ